MSAANIKPAGTASKAGFSAPRPTATRQRADDKARLAAIDAELLLLGYRMEPSLSVLDGQGHCVIELATGESIDPPAGAVLDLAIEWTLLGGGCPEVL